MHGWSNASDVGGLQELLALGRLGQRGLEGGARDPGDQCAIGNLQPQAGQRAGRPLGRRHGQRLCIQRQRQAHHPRRRLLGCGRLLDHCRPAAHQPSLRGQQALLSAAADIFVWSLTASPDVVPAAKREVQCRPFYAEQEEGKGCCSLRSSRVNMCACLGAYDTTNYK